MKIQTLGTAALPAAIFLAVQPLSSQKDGCAQVERNQKSSQRASLRTEDAKEDELSLAVYFGELAVQERALADSYGRVAAVYNDKTSPPGTDDATARELKIHYRRLAEAAKKAAEAVEGVAAYHCRLAAQLGHTPAPSSPTHAPQSFSALGK